MACSIAGTDGVVKWAYHTAATVGAWTLTASTTGGELTAAVRTSDPFKLAQPDLKFLVPRQNGPALAWPVHSLHVADGTLTASLGPQE